MIVTRQGTVGMVRGETLRANVDLVIAALNATEHYRQSAIAVRTDRVSARSMSFTLRVATGTTGAALTWSGRRSWHGCWHLHRDVLLGLMASEPLTRVRTAGTRHGVDYRGLRGFMGTFLETGDFNVGSENRIVKRRDACRCALDVGCFGPEVKDALRSLARDMSVVRTIDLFETLVVMYS